MLTKLATKPSLIDGRRPGETKNFIESFYDIWPRLKSPFIDVVLYQCYIAGQFMCTIPVSSTRWG